MPIPKSLLLSRIQYIHYSPEGKPRVACGKLIVARHRTHLTPAVTCPACIEIITCPEKKAQL